MSLVSIMSHWDDNNHWLYIPLIDVESRMVGYKVLSISNEVDGNVIIERTVPETNCSGLIYLRCTPITPVASGKVGSKEQSNAILVLNVLDLLALSATKINGEHFI